MNDDLHWMREAYALAECAAQLGEVPVGAIVVRAGEILGRGHNQPITSTDPTAHAEIVALRDAARDSGNYRLPGSTLYVTIEPCTMCAGALLHARVERLVFAAREPREGSVRSVARVLEIAGRNHTVAVTEGIFAEECGALLRRFFRRRRSRERDAAGDASV
ncbi:MAG: tRNA adenosine(34) deaminase TadA [Gammaproteobacteria bacterium]|nr:MAG: tRNA adenosine(34) deaminase TadA [Gammaproteobacteria bacterium]